MEVKREEVKKGKEEVKAIVQMQSAERGRAARNQVQALTKRGMSP